MKKPGLFLVVGAGGIAVFVVVMVWLLTNPTLSNPNNPETLSFSLPPTTLSCEVMVRQETAKMSSTTSQLDVGFNTLPNGGGVAYCRKAPTVESLTCDVLVQATGSVGRMESTTDLMEKGFTIIKGPPKQIIYCW